MGTTYIVSGMTSTIEIPDEFEEFRARSYSGGCRVALLSTVSKERNSQNIERTISRSPCPAEFDTSDSEDERKTRRRGSSLEARTNYTRSPSPRPGPGPGPVGFPRRGSAGPTAGCAGGGSSGPHGLKVPRNYRTRSVSPQSTLGSARIRARMKVEEMRKLMAKKSEDSQDEFFKTKDVITQKPPAGPRRRKSGESEAGGAAFTGSAHLNHQNQRRTSSPMESRFLSHMSFVVLDADDELGDMRPRVATEPSRTLSKRSFRSEVPHPSNAHRDSVPFHTVRHFTITCKGNVVSQGQYLSKSSTSLGSYESASSTYSAASDDLEDYTVLILGNPGVGKNALIDKFLPPHNVESSSPCPGKSVKADVVSSHPSDSCWAELSIQRTVCPSIVGCCVSRASFATFCLQPRLSGRSAQAAATSLPLHALLDDHKN